METTVTFFPLESHVGSKRFLEGELVEVRQQEKGLQGSWHPAVVIGVKAGRRVVEYDELLTDDGREKLTESIAVSRCLDGGKAIPRQPWRPAAKRSRVLLRPRPPPLPDPASINWSRGLSVDCYSQDAWWEGVLMEGISSSSRNKRAVVWFPEEEDWEAMFLKDMRVGQQWDEETGKWSLKGCVDIPDSMLKSRVKNICSGTGDWRGIGSSSLRRFPNSLQVPILNAKEPEYTSSRITAEGKLADVYAENHIQLHSPNSTRITPHQAMSDDGARADCPLEMASERALVTRFVTADSLPSSTLNGMSGCDWKPRLSFLVSAFEGKGDAGRVLSRKTSTVRSDLERRFTIEQSLISGETVDDGRLICGSTMTSMTRTRNSVDTFKSEGDASLEMKRVDLQNSLVSDDDKCRQFLKDSGWSIGQTRRKNGISQWFYRSPNGCLLDSLASAMGMWRQMTDNDSNSSEGENPTLHAMKSSEYHRDSKLTGGYAENGRKSKQFQPAVCAGSEDEGKDRLNRNLPGHFNGSFNPKPGCTTYSILKPFTRSGDGIGVPFASKCKRHALATDLVLDRGHTKEAKRRRTRCPSAEPNAPCGFQVSMPSGGSVELTDEVVPVVHNVRTLALNQSKQGDFKKKLPTDSCNDENVHVLVSNMRSKKRTCGNESSKLEQSTYLLNSCSEVDRFPIHDTPTGNEPRSKKTKVTSDESTPTVQRKSRKTVEILHNSSQKKDSKTVQKCCDVKQTKTGGTRVNMSSPVVKNGKKGRTPSRGVRLEVLLAPPGNNRDSVLGEGELTRKRTLLSWLIDNGKVVEHEKVRYLHRKDLHCMLEGFVTREGILCNCCKKVVTLSVFEAHAGSKLHRPSANIFLDNGRSLSICQVEALAVKTQKESDAQQVLVYSGSAVDKSDDTCGFCGDGGILILCDHCPSTYHLSCMGLKEIPDGDWYCPNCRCGSCGGSQFNADQTTFNDFTVIFCEQCEFEYHVKCLRDRGLVLDSIPQDAFFCGDSCKTIFQRLRRLVGVCQGMEDGFSWTLLRSVADDNRKTGCIPSMEINAEHDSKLSIALNVMQECFRPMIDPRTKIDIIAHVLYNRRSDVNRLNYHGFYTMLLERGDELISVATVRVHGPSLAEMPLIGTRFQYRRQGMCRRLMGALEKMLKTMGVERLVLPAVPDLLDTWIGAFGFKPMDEGQRLELMDMNIMAFPETSILYKWLSKARPGDKKAVFKTVFEASHVETVQPVSQSKYARVSSQSHSVTIKRGRGRPPKSRMGMASCNDGILSVAKIETPRTSKGSHIVQHAVFPVSSQPVHVKRGRGRPPKNKVAIVMTNDTNSTVSLGFEAHELADVDRGYDYCFEGGVGEGLQLGPDDDGVQQEIDALPAIFQRKRGRPRRVREHCPSLSSFGPLSTKASVGLHQERLLGDNVEGSSSPMDAEMEDTYFIPSQRISERKFSSDGCPGVDNLMDSALIRNTTLTLREVTTPDWLLEYANGKASAAEWLVHSANGKPNSASMIFTGQETRHKDFTLESPCLTDHALVQTSTTASTKTYERRRTKLSPKYQLEHSKVQDDVSEREMIYKISEFYVEHDNLESEAVIELQQKAISVPIRTFPSQFASRGDKTILPETFIPVETVVLSPCLQVEPLQELSTAASHEKWSNTFHLEDGEGNLPLLRLQLSMSSKDLSAHHLLPS